VLGSRARPYRTFHRTFHMFRGQCRNTAPTTQDAAKHWRPACQVCTGRARQHRLQPVMLQRTAVSTASVHGFRLEKCRRWGITPNAPGHRHFPCDCASVVPRRRSRDLSLFYKARPACPASLAITCREDSLACEQLTQGGLTEKIGSIGDTPMA